MNNRIAKWDKMWHHTGNCVSSKTVVKLSLYEGRLSQIADVHEELRCVCKYHEMTDNCEMYKISGNTDLKKNTTGRELVCFVRRYFGFRTSWCFHPNWSQIIVDDG